MPRVLVVDENKTARKALCGLLEQEGFRVLEAASGEAAQRLLKQATPEVVLLGLGNGGMAALRNARELDPTTPIVTLSDRGADRLHGDYQRGNWLG